ncbi:uncharacterized protein LOC101855803 [Aplysia californica]|uniref:Uncharacterized protein LOC101855803 n=1 Tax=Aplysia californica TaxID=6500 RepID=A0ABM1VVI0_APLCA|nr:uncharacterized protein LOC101855803 [Aplysia californica]
MQEGFSWEDSTPVSYTRWAASQPSWTGRDEADQGCVALNPDGTWTNRDCLDQLSFLCRSEFKFRASSSTTAVMTPHQQTPAGVTTNVPTTAHQVTPPHPPVSGPSVPPSPANPSGPPSVAAPVSTGPTTPKSLRSLSSGETSSVTIRIPSTKKHVGGKPTKNSGGISDGDKAAIIVSVLAIVILLVVGVLYVLQRRGSLRSSFLRREASRMKNFENSLYEETRKDSKEGESVNIIALKSDSRSFSVSYNVTPTTSDENGVNYQQFDSSQMPNVDDDEDV